MRGSDAASGSMFSYVDLEKRVRRDHLLRVIRAIVNEVLASLSADLEAMYAAGLLWRSLGAPDHGAAGA